MARFKQMKPPKAQKATGVVQGGRVSSRLEVATRQYFQSIYTEEVHCIATMQTFKWYLGAEVPATKYLVLFRVSGGVHHGPSEASVIDLKNYCPRIYEKTATFFDINAVKAGAWKEIFWYENGDARPIVPLKRKAGLFA